MATIQYLSHSAFLIKENENTILIDPFITGNPNNVVQLEDLNPNYIVLTHAHGDHLGDAIEISRRNNALIICVNELGVYLSELGINNHKMHIGGAYNFPFGRLKFTIAHHGSSTNDGRYMGEPAGVVIQLKNKTIYHCGDTGLFLDMKLIGELNKIDVMLVPIGDNFTMGIDDAVIAVDFVNPELAIPMHYNTFPIIAADPFEFKNKCEAINKKAIVLQFGEVLELN